MEQKQRKNSTKRSRKTVDRSSGKVMCERCTCFLCWTATIQRKSYLKEAKSYLINISSLLGGITVDNEPDWSSLTLPELLEKARECGNKAYSGSLSTYAFLERAREKSPKHPDLSD